MTTAPPRRRGLSLRLRLTFSYAAFLVVAGAAMFGVLLLVLRYLPDSNLVDATGDSFVPNRSDLLEVALPLAGCGMALLVVIGLAGGWLLAGRMLRPIGPIDAAVRMAGAGSLEHRIALTGPDDELRRLADGFDDMLARLQRSFDEQQRFTANASHELRTPLAITKTMLEVAQSVPGGQAQPGLLSRLDEVNERSIRILEALLRLSRADSTPPQKQPVELDELVEAVVARETADAKHTINTPLDHVITSVDRDLTEQLVTNLVRNAVTHQVDGGHVWVRTFVDGSGRPTLEVENTGDVMSAELVATLAEPFVRAAGRIRGPAGSGLGLALVASIARAHGADLMLSARAGGGLIATVRFA